MSPEQARGTAGDFRTDQFSFGALLYEMATGQYAFRRDTMADTLVGRAARRTEADHRAQPAHPDGVSRWIIEQCLAKDAAERYAATEDLARELRRLRERLRKHGGRPGLGSNRGGSRRWAMPVAASLALAARSRADRRARLPRTRDARVSRRSPRRRHMKGRRAGRLMGRAWRGWRMSTACCRFSRDGWPMRWPRRSHAASSTPSSHSGRRMSTRVVFHLARGRRAMDCGRVGTAGGRAELVLENVNHAAIDPSGRQLAAPAQRNNDATSGCGGRPRTVTIPVRSESGPLRRERGFGLGGQLQFRPDGQGAAGLGVQRSAGAMRKRAARYFLVSDRAGGRGSRSAVERSEPRQTCQPFSWLPDNRHVVVGIADARWRHRDTCGSPIRSRRRSRQLTSTHTNETWPSVVARRTAHRLRFRRSRLRSGRDLRGRTHASALLATARNEMDPAWSPDGDQFAFVTDRTGGMEHLGAQPRRAVGAARWCGRRILPTRATETLGSLAFSPDGRTLAFFRRGTKEATLWLVTDNWRHAGRND